MDKFAILSIAMIFLLSQVSCFDLEEEIRSGRNISLDDPRVKDALKRNFGGLLNFLISSPTNNALTDAALAACKAPLAGTATVKLATGTYFFFTGAAVTWQAASDQCAQRGMGLLAIETQAEETAIENQIAALTAVLPATNFWTGLNNQDNVANYVWSSTGAARTFGAANVPPIWPALPGVGASCGFIVSPRAGNFNWGTQGCALTALYICEASAICNLLL